MLQGKSAVITGSTSGIGFGIAKVLARAGANIMLNGFADAATIDACKAEIAGLNVKVAFNPCDVSKADQVEGMIDSTLQALGSVDIMVNNAGIQFVAPVEEFPLAKWDAVLGTNLSAAFYATRKVVPLMKAKGWGRIINIASVQGLVGSLGKAAYVAAKHGLVGLTKVVGLETAGSGVTCNAICPGWVLTPLVQQQIDAIAARDGLDNTAASEKLLSEKQPSLQFVQTEDVGAMALYLCSDAAQQVTGTALSIDGGWAAR